MDEVELVAYDPQWPALFAVEAARVRAALPRDVVLGIEHFGSTAIPGMAAKPVIDILIAVRSLDEARSVAVAPLEAIDYDLWRDNPRRDRMFFVKGLPPRAPRRTHHVHLTELDGEAWVRLAFRDYLRTNSDAAERYAILKRDLATRFAQDREAYTDAKAAFVDETMRKLATRPIADTDLRRAGCD